MATKRFPGPDSIGRLGISPDPTDFYTHHIETYRALFEEDSSTTIFAFMALTSAMSYWWSQEEGAPQPEQVGVPFWALEAIVTGFLNYHDKVKTGESAHLDREMGFVSDGKGKKPRLVEKLRRHRDLNASLAIALDRESGLSTTDAVKAASTRFLISEKTVWRLWSKNKDFAIKSLENFRTLTTSRGAEIDPES